MARGAFVLAFIACVLSMLMLYNGHNWGGDFSQYIAQSIALIDNSIDSQIANNTWIIQNSFDGLGPYIYPWGTSLLLAPIYKIFGFDLIAFKMLFCVLYGIFVGIFFYVCRQFVDIKFCIIATMLFALNPLFLNFNNNIISDIPFMLFSFISAFCLSKLLNYDFADIGGGGQNKQYNIIKYALFGGVFAGLAYITRNNGIVIIVALLLCHLLVFVRFKHKITFRRFYIVYFALPYIMFIIIAFTVDNIFGRGGSGHLELLSQISLKSIVRNCIYYTFIFGEFFALPTLKFDFKYSLLLPNLGFILFALSIPLIWQGIKSCFHTAKMQTIFIVLFMLGNMTLLILWPGLQGIRFVFCVIPFIVLFGIVGFTKTLKYQKIIKITFITIMLFFITKDCVYVYLNATNQYRGLNAYSDSAKDIYGFIQQNLPQDSKIAFFKPRVLYLNTNRLSFYPLKDEDFLKCNFVLEYLPIKDENTMPQNPQNREFLEKIYENSEFILYKMPTFSS